MPKFFDDHLVEWRLFIGALDVLADLQPGRLEAVRVFEVTALVLHGGFSVADLGLLYFLLQFLSQIPVVQFRVQSHQVILVVLSDISAGGEYIDDVSQETVALGLVLGVLSGLQPSCLETILIRHVIQLLL